MTQGLYAKLADGVFISAEVLVVGYKVPKAHTGNGWVQVYLVCEHPKGREFTVPGIPKPVKLLAYPSHWPGPGDETKDRTLFCNIETLAWRGKLIPVFDTESDDENT